MKYKSQIKAANECGVGRETIARAVRRAGIKLTGHRESGNHGGGSKLKISDEQIIEAAKTMTRQEIAERYGIHIARLDHRLRRLGVHAVHAKPKQRPAKPPEWRFSEEAALFVDQSQGSRFELIEFKRRRYKIKCKECGTIIERDRTTIKRNNVICDECERKKQQEAELNKKQKELTYVLIALAEQKKPKICEWCGEVFYSEVPSKKYCSKKCKDRSHKKRYRAIHKTTRKATPGHYSSRARKYGVEYESGITLKKIFNRDKGICQICGKPTDWNDHSWGESFGALYPTIDHIKALANGGGHTWDNVQLAHAICNAYKRDTA